MGASQDAVHARVVVVVDGEEVELPPQRGEALVQGLVEGTGDEVAVVLHHYSVKEGRQVIG